MDDRKKRKYNAAVAGDAAMTNHAADIAGNAPLLAKQTAMQGVILKIDDDNKKRDRDKGYATMMAKDLHTMQDDALSIAALLVEYAKQTNDDVLLHKIDFDKTDLSHGAETERKKNAQIIYDAANANVAAMIAAGYQITAPQVAALLADIGKVTSDEGGTKANIADTVAATDALDKDFVNLKDAEESIFNFMKPYAATKPDAYNAIMDAFEPSDIGKRMIALRIAVSDTVTNIRLENAEVVIVELALKKKSSKRGIVDFSHQELPAGNYTVQITLHGYVVFTQANVGVSDVKLMRVDGKLVKL